MANKPPAERSFNRFKHVEPIALPPSVDETAPRSSWWVGATREQLQERAEAQRHRMDESRFGRLRGAGGLE